MEHQITGKYRSVAVKAYMILFFSSLLYGGNVISAKVIAGQIPPFTLSALRGLLGLVILVPLAWPKFKKAPKPSQRDLLKLCLLGFLGISVPYVTIMLGMEHSSATNASIIFATNPALTNGLAVLIYKVRLSKYEMLGIVASFLGLLIVFTQGSLAHLFSFSLSFSDLFLLVNVVSVAIFNIIGQSVMEKFSSLVSSVYALIFGTILLIPLATRELAASGLHLSWLAWLIVIYMGCLVTGVAFFFNLEGINQVGSGKASIFSNLQQVFSILLGVILLGERLALYHWIGIALVVSGIILSIIRR